MHVSVQPMRELLTLAIHVLVTCAKLSGPGGVRVVAAESLLLRHQLLISNRSRQRAPNLTSVDRFVLGLTSLLISPGRIPKLGALLKPATLLKFHKALVERKYRLLFSSFVASPQTRSQRSFGGADRRHCRDEAVTRRARLTSGRRPKLTSEKSRIRPKQVSRSEDSPGPRWTPESSEIWSMFDAGLHYAALGARPPWLLGACACY